MSGGGSGLASEPFVIGRYALYGELASGGMATVFLGRLLGPVGFSRTVAIKRLHEQFAKDADFAAMLLDEARLVSRIRHPNVVPTIDVIAEQGQLLLVMEYFEGASLAQLVRAVAKRGQSVPAPIAVSILGGVLHGLHAAHEATSEHGAALGIVHRDVSPQNLLVCVDGLARVLDFGIAKAAGRLHVTREGSLKGKLAYMAPEQIADEPVTPRTDVYAAAVVLWETLTGKRLFWGDNEASILAKVLEAKIEPPSAVAEGIPEGVDRVVLRGLARDPSDRYPTARAMALALEECAPAVNATRVGAWVRESVPEDLSRRAALVASIEGSSKAESTGATKQTLAELVSRPSLPEQTPTLDAGPNEGGTPAGASRPSSRHPRGRGYRFSAWGIAGLGAAVLIGLVAHRSWRDGGTRAQIPSAAPSSSVPTSPHPTAITDLPPPNTANPAARAAYLAGLQAIRDDNSDRASDDFARALKLDPGMAEAALRSAMLAWMDSNSTETRERFAAVVSLRSQLGQRDQVLMTALEPLLSRQPADLTEAAKRLEAATLRFPLDAELFDWLAVLRIGDPQASLAAATRAVELDEKDAFGLENQGRAFATLGKVDQASTTLDRCTAISPQTTDCLWWKEYADATEGRCADAERDARTILDRAPKVAASYQGLAGALFAVGVPEPTVRETLAQGATFISDARRDYLPAGLAAATGNFTAARALTRDARARLGADPFYNPQYFAALGLVSAALEAGDRAEAEDVAADFAERSAAWASAEGPTQGIDKSLWLASLARRNKLTAAEFETRRKAWIDARLTKSHAHRGLVWIYAYAATAETAADAALALAELPSYEPLTSFVIAWVGIPDAEVGHVYFLAGRLDEAVRYLERAVANCNVLRWPFEQVRAAWELGQAREAKGDRTGACDAYKIVLGRWSNAKPRSVTADRAKARVKALACAG